MGPVELAPAAAGLWTGKGGRLTDALELVRVSRAADSPGLLLELRHVPDAVFVSLLCLPAGAPPDCFALGQHIAVCARSDLSAGAAEAVRRLVPRLDESAFAQRVVVQSRRFRVLDAPSLWKQMLDEQPGTLILSDGCDEDCAFCSAPSSGLTGRDALPPDGAVRERIERWARAGLRDLDIVSREPTLNPRLAEYIALAKRCGYRSVRMNSNGVRLAERGLLESLATAGLDELCVSLHSPVPEESDQVTGRPGGFDAKVETLRRAQALSLRVTVSTVVHEANYRRLPDLARFVHKRFFRLRNRVGLVLSFVGPLGRAASRSDLLPRYRDVRPHLSAALAAYGQVRVHPAFNIPLCCAAPADRKRIAPARALLNDRRRYVPACEQCRVRDRCNGIWTAYLERYGDAEFSPVTSG